MKIEQPVRDSFELILPQMVYTPHLEIINGVSLTRREVDMIACILSGKSVKKIASFLLISPKTVENHIRNILQKLGCRTQGGIIDLVEKSGKYTLIKKYYSSLLIQSVFESEIKKISLLHHSDYQCILLYNPEQKSKLPVIRQLEQHLQLVGFKTVSECRELSQSAAYIIQKISLPNTRVVYNIPISLDNEDIETMNLIQTSNKTPNTLIFLSIEERSYSQIFAETCPALLSLPVHENYYFLVFELLKRFLPDISLDKNIAEFKQQCLTLLDPGFVRVLHEQSAPFMEMSKTNKMPALSKIIRRPKIILGSFLLIFFCLGLFIYYLKLNPNAIDNASHISMTKAMPLILTDLKVGKASTWNLPRQDYLFIGRDKLLEELHNHFQIRNTTSPIKPVAISACTGLGGIGKTQLALHFAHNNKHAYNLKAWFSAENTDHLRQKYLEFAKALGYVEKIPTIESAILYVNRLLLEHPGWLLIFDNVNTYEEIASFIPEGGGHVILTTRNRQWPDKFQILAIDTMTDTESFNLLTILIHRPIAPQEISETKELVKLLGYLPLAIAQAGAYIQQNRISISDYLSLYKKHESELLLDTTIEGNHHVPVAITWDISVAELTKKSSLKHEDLIALFILKSTAYLAADKIPQDLLLAFLKEAYPNLTSPELCLSKAIGQLWKYSLINTNEKGEISIHRLMQVVLRDQHKHPQKKPTENVALTPITAKWYHYLLKGIYFEFRKNTQLLENDVRTLNLLPHFQSLLYHHQKTWPNTDSPDLGRLYRGISLALHLSGDLKYALDYSKTAFKISEKYSNQHPEDVAKNLNNLGFISLEMGEVKNAKVFLEQSLSIYEKLYPKNSVNNVVTMSNLGRVYENLGEPKKAKALLESVLSILKKHPDEKELFDLVLADTFRSLGDAYWDLNEVERGKNVLKEALNILEKHYGKNHPRVAKTLFSLSGAYGDSGDYRQQKLLLERALSIDEQYYGTMHPETAKTLTMLGDTYRVLGDAKKAKAFLERALTIREQYYGMNHPEVARTLNKLGDAYSDLGDALQAKSLHERTLKIREQYYGKNHPAISKALNALSNDYGFLGDPKQQLLLSTRALSIQEAYYGTNHPEIANTISTLAYAHWALGDAKQSKILLERALAIKAEHFGNNHPEVAKTMAALGDVYGDMGEFNHKVCLLEKTLKIKEDYYGLNHPLVAQILTSLGDAYRDLGDLKKSKELLTRALSISEHHYGITHPEVAKTLISLGNTYQSLGNLKRAKQLHERSLRIREAYYGQDHFEVSQILTTLGLVYLQLGDTDEAVKILNRALNIKETFYGKNHPEVAKTLLNLVQVHIRVQQQDKAKLLGERCYAIFLESYGKENFYTKKIISLIGNQNLST